MSDPLGDLCLVLHGHLPYVLNHGTAPHGEAWLYEAAAETYLPLLDVLASAVAAGERPAVTVGLTPVLLEQLAHDRFFIGFPAYVAERAGRARHDRQEFERAGDAHSAALADRWEQWYAATGDHFDRLGHDIPGAFARLLGDGQIQMLAGAATHAYAPLLLNDEMFRAQLACGLETTSRHLGGVRPTGLWLPECAYRPAAEAWVPPVLYDNPRRRPGVEQAVADAGLDHFFVDQHQVSDAVPLGLWSGGQFREVNETQAYWDRARGWGSPLEPVGAVSTLAASAGGPRAYALARHPRVSEQVWSSHVGYPAAGAYLEFHRRHGEGGLRYHRVTDTKAPLSHKQPYRPADADAKVAEHAAHFLAVVAEVLVEHRSRTGRAGVVVAPFDAELFGHWWFEGPRFLRAVIAAAAADPRVRLSTAQAAVAARRPDMVVRMPEGSWGEHGDDSVWLNDKTRWMWEVEYRAEGHFLKLLHELPWRTNDGVRATLTRAARQLLLMQASDWPFVVHSGGAVDYGIKRFAGHATRFDRMTDGAVRAARGEGPDAVEQVRVAEADLHDAVFRDIDLAWWLPP
jgi:1,4-alpha-glucan branching enzyme